MSPQEIEDRGLTVRMSALVGARLRLQDLFRAPRVPVHPWSILALAFALVAWPATASAQTTRNPRTVSFLPSPDHNALESDGRAVLSWYDLEIYERGAADRLLAVNLGKPSPSADGYISLDFVSMLAWRPQGVLLEARVVAVGPGGSNASEPSNPFMFDGCTVTVTPANLEVAPEGGTGTVSVSADAACTWQSRSAVDWVTVTGGSSGSGNGTVTFAATANLSGSDRTGTLGIGDRVVTVVQTTDSAAPAVFVRAPSDGARFMAPARITITAGFAAFPASASSARTRGEGREKALPGISRISFYANGTLVGTASASPYTVSWSNVAAGTYTITVVATDSRGRQRTSRPVAVSVRPPFFMNIWLK